MQIEWLWGLFGGLIIGSAAALYLLVNGRIMGASGIIGELADGSARGSNGERLAFVAALVAVPAIAARLLGQADTQLTTNFAVVIGAGLLVGVGTRLANGCTSGHGVCGLSRLSPRGIAATVIYLLAGGISVLLFRHIWGVI
ncbi:MAG: YeeE/YedE thiosulfate transporter family protein [Albidovulum sp.]